MHTEKIVDLDAHRGPQAGDGDSRLPNELLDAMIARRFTAPEWTLLAFLIRRTYGYQRPTARLSVTQIADGCGFDRDVASATLQALERQSVIHRMQRGGAMQVSINEQCRQWGEVASLPLFAGEAAPSVDPDGGFERFWAEYPKRKHRNRKRALRAFRALNPDPVLLAQMIEAIRLARDTEDWRKENGQYIPLPETWIRAEGWLDEIERPVYTERQTEVMRLYNALLASKDWPEAITDPYSPARASAIDQFLGFSPKPDMPERYFRHCAEVVEIRDGCGFDWLLTRDTFLRIREGRLTRRDGNWRR